MLTYTKLKEKLMDVAYTITEDNNKAIIDMVTDDGVYISQWNKSLKNYERIYFKADEFLAQVNEGQRQLKADKIECTLEQLRSKRRDSQGYHVLVEGIDKTREDKDIAGGKLKEGEYIFNTRGEMRFIEINDKINKRYLISIKRYSNKDDEETIKQEREYAFANNERYWYTREKLAEVHQVNRLKVVSLKTFIAETLGVKLKDVLITDLPGHATNK